MGDRDKQLLDKNKAGKRRKGKLKGRPNKEKTYCIQCCQKEKLYLEPLNQSSAIVPSNKKNCSSPDLVRCWKIILCMLKFYTNIKNNINAGTIFVDACCTIIPININKYSKVNCTLNRVYKMT